MAGAAPQGNQSDNSMALIWVIAAIFVALAVIWYTSKKYIVSGYLKIKLLEISLLSHFTAHFEDVRTYILTTAPEKFSLQDVLAVGNAVGDYIRFPLVLLVLVLAVLVYMANATRLFKRTYSMKDLVTAEKNNWPQIIPVAGLDLIHTDIDQGPWAMAMTPMQFCKKYKLLEEYRRPPQEGMSRKEWNKVEVNLIRGKANRLFMMQLGPTWQGIEKLSLHTKSLFTVFAARINADTKPAMELLSRMSASSTTKLDFSGTDELLQKHWNTKLVQKIAQNHAYVLTLMASMLEGARQDGVQATADFLWLKPIDRRLWYMLNTVGRQTPFAEVGGPYAHWLAEKELGKKLLVPMIEEATNALEIALKEIIYKPDEVE